MTLNPQDAGKLLAEVARKLKLKHNDAPFPHCDSRVLHEPNECSVCDQYPHYQALRIAWSINFTGHGKATDKNYVKGKMLPCPADWNRGPGAAHVWYGNYPAPPQACEDDQHFEEPRE